MHYFIQEDQKERSEEDSHGKHFDEIKIQRVQGVPIPLIVKHSEWDHVVRHLQDFYQRNILQQQPVSFALASGSFLLVLFLLAQAEQTNNVRNYAEEAYDTLNE